MAHRTPLAHAWERAAREQLRCIAKADDGEHHDADDVDSLTHTLQRVSEPASEPFSLTGEDGTGGENWIKASQLETGAQYVDALTHQTLHDRIPRQLGNCSIHVELTTHDPDGVSDWIQVELETWGGDRCAWGGL